MLSIHPRVIRSSPSLRRLQSTLNVAIVGSGPSGFYTAHDLLKRPNVHVTMFEKLPTPFGLSRYGVAPDHLEVKNCEETFSSAADNDRFDFKGNCYVGKDISLKELHERFNSVVLAYGCSHGTTLGIKGEDLPGVINAHEFVGWYNGSPDNVTRPVLEKCKDVVIIGNGNVAMDISRLLLMPVEEIQKSDITEHAISILKKSSVQNVKIVARRGFLESAFATKEVRELLQLEKFGVKFDGVDEEIIKTYLPIKNKMERVIKRKLDTILEYMQPDELRKTKKKFQIPDSYNKNWKLEYLMSPIEIKPNPQDDQLVSEVVFQKNQLVHDSPDSPTKVQPTNEFKTLKADLVITSLGFRGSSIEGLEELGAKFDQGRGIVSTRDSRVLDLKGDIIKGLYATGWIKNSKKGPILNTLVDSNSVAQAIIDDFNNGITSTEKLGNAGLAIKNSTDWKDWQKLNEFELGFGALNDKARWKVPQVSKMLEIIRKEDDLKSKLTHFKDWLLSYH